MKDSMGVSPSKGNQGTTRGKEKYFVTFANKPTINEINSMFFNFLWDGKGDKIKHDIMISYYNNGELRMIDIKLFNKALKSSWKAKYLDSENHGKWKLLFDLELQSFGGEEVFRDKLSKEDLSKYFKILDTFISEILRIWMDITSLNN